MKKSIIAVAIAAGLSLAGTALAQNHGAGTSSVSVAGAVASGYGGGVAYTHTSGWQSASSGYQGGAISTGPTWWNSDQGSLAAVQGHAKVAGEAKSATFVFGNAAAGSLTAGESYAWSRGSESASTPQTYAGTAGGARASNYNIAGTAGAFFYVGKAHSKTAAGAEYEAGALAAHDGYWGGHDDYVYTDASAGAYAMPDHNHANGFGFGIEGAAGHAQAGARAGAVACVHGACYSD